jgi:hypothetical protein
VLERYENGMKPPGSPDFSTAKDAVEPLVVPKAYSSVRVGSALIASSSCPAARADLHDREQHRAFRARDRVGDALQRHVGVVSVGLKQTE